MLANLYRELPAFKGKNRLARFFFGHAINHSRDITVRGSYGVQYRLPNLRENVGFDIFVNGAYEPEYMQFLAERIPRNGVFLDLGANIGSICIPLAKLRTDVQIVAVEASPRVFGYLRHNVELNGCRNIRIENYALSDKDFDEVVFYSPEEKFGKGSMSPVFTKNAEYTTSITLDTLVKNCNLGKADVIKIDVEGYEKLVLSGGNALLSRADAPIILFEFAHWAENQARGCKAGDAQRLLLDFHYKLYNVNNPARPVPLEHVLETGTYMILADKKTA